MLLPDEESALLPHAGNHASKSTYTLANLLIDSMAIIMGIMLAGLIILGIALGGLSIASIVEYTTSNKPTSCAISNCQLRPNNYTQRVQITTSLQRFGSEIVKKNQRATYPIISYNDSSFVIRIGQEYFFTNRTCDNLQYIPCYYDRHEQDVFSLKPDPTIKPLYIFGVVYLSVTIASLLLITCMLIMAGCCIQK